MKLLSTGLCTFAIFLLISSPPRVTAQTRVNATGVASLPRYEMTAEVTLHGRVSSVLTTAAPGMIPGAHLLLATPSGSVDASLGRYGLRGRGAVSVASGQKIDATGVIKTMNNRTVFLVRTLKVGDEVYRLRSEHGVLLSPQARQRSAQKIAQNGEAQ